MAIFLDTGILVGMHNNSDSLHAAAKNIFRRIAAGEFGNAYTSDYVIDEGTAVTYARTKSRNQSKSLLTTCLKSSGVFEILSVGSTGFKETAQEYLKQPELSFTDCSNLILMRQNGIRNIATFDSGFKRIPDIRVINE